MIQDTVAQSANAFRYSAVWSMPIAHEPADLYVMIEAAHAALAASTYPKLLFAADPGTLISPELAEDFARHLSNCRLVKLGSGLHFLQEDHPEMIGRSVAASLSKSRPSA